MKNILILFVTLFAAGMNNTNIIPMVDTTCSLKGRCGTCHQWKAVCPRCANCQNCCFCR